MAFRPLKSFFPTADELLAADLPRLGEILLVHLNSYEGKVKQNGRLNRGYLLGMLENRSMGLGSMPKEPEYGARQPEVTQAVMEAWNWLEREGLLIRDPQQPADWFTISRRGEELLKRYERYERWEKLGLDRVKSDLMNNEGRRTRDVGSGPEALDMAWEWVRMKEKQKTPGVAAAASATEMVQPSRKVFVVHGHDEGAREKIARFIERAGFDPIILHEQASGGRTVIEKVEAHGNVGFAVVLLTPDDEGCEKGGTPRPRARQNVVLELGYFIGRLGRNRVCALKRGDVEIPSDFTGVVYVPFDDSDGWKQSLGRELQAAGFEIDWSKAMGAH